MSASIESSRRVEHDTPTKVRFFHSFEDQNQTIAAASRAAGIPRSTGSRWVKERKELGEKAFRRKRTLSTTLGRKNSVCEAQLFAILKPDHPSHSLPYDKIVEKENIPITGRSLRRQFAKIGAKRYRKPAVRPISAANKLKRIQYGHRHRQETVRGFWQWVYFTDEAHFNSRELSSKDVYELRLPNSQDRLERLQETPMSINVTIHVAAGISYNHKGAFLFYNDPAEPGPKEYVYKHARPRKSKYESQEEHEECVRRWEARQPPEVDVRPKGNSMTQLFYSEQVLPHHIEHIKQLEARYSRQIYFQEDNDGSHGTRSANNLPRQLKEASHLTMLTHPPQSPDLNPIEPIWRAMKQRLRGRNWGSVQAFKSDIEAEWHAITLPTIRKRISEMSWRCNQCIKLDGKRIRSKLW
jgi:hypothetical protein